MEHTQPLMDHLEINQIGIVVKDIEKAMKHLSSLWNVGSFQFVALDVPDAILHGKQMPLKAKLAFAQAGAVQLELIEPGEGESIYWEFLHVKGEGVHHFGLLVSDIENALAKFKKRGIEVLQSGDTSNVSFAYMDTESIAGVILELLQRKQSSA